MSAKPVVLLTNAIHPDGEAILSPHARLVVAPDTRPETLRAHGRRCRGHRGARQVARRHRRSRAETAKAWSATASASISSPSRRRPRAASRWPICPAATPQAVAEYCISGAAAFAPAAGDAMDGLCAVKAGRRPAQSRTDLTEIGGSTLGILGVGTIGGRIASIAHDGFGMKVLGTSRSKATLPPVVEHVRSASCSSKATRSWCPAR